MKSIASASDVTDTFQMLLNAAREHEMTLPGDFRVGEADAEILLGYAPRTLRKLREHGRAPKHYKLGNRYTYRIQDLADWIDGGLVLAVSGPDGCV